MWFKYALTAVKMAVSTFRQRKRVVLSLENKLSTLDRIAKGEKATKVAGEFGIGNSVVTDLKKNESIENSIICLIDGESFCICSKVLTMKK